MNKTFEKNAELYAITAMVFGMAKNILEDSEMCFDFCISVWDECIIETTGLNPAIVQNTIELPKSFAGMVLLKMFEKWNNISKEVVSAAFSKAL